MLITIIRNFNGKVNNNAASSDGTRLFREDIKLTNKHRLIDLCILRGLMVRKTPAEHKTIHRDILCELATTTKMTNQQEYSTIKDDKSYSSSLKAFIASNDQLHDFFIKRLSLRFVI